MTKLEHFKLWASERYPNIGQSGETENGVWWFYHDILQIAWKSFQAGIGLRPTEDSKITKEQIAAMKEDDPATIVDRLLGIYPTVVDPYPVPNVQREAAREIERLRGELDIYNRSMHRFNTIEELMDHLNSPQ